MSYATERGGFWYDTDVSEEFYDAFQVSRQRLPSNTRDGPANTHQTGTTLPQPPMPLSMLLPHP